MVVAVEEEGVFEKARPVLVTVKGTVVAVVTVTDVFVLIKIKIY